MVLTKSEFRQPVILNAGMKVCLESYVLAGSGSSPEVGSFSRSSQGSDGKCEEGEVSGHGCWMYELVRNVVDGADVDECSEGRVSALLYPDRCSLGALTSTNRQLSPTRLDVARISNGAS